MGKNIELVCFRDVEVRKVSHFCNFDTYKQCLLHLYQWHIVIVLELQLVSASQSTAVLLTVVEVARLSFFWVWKNNLLILVEYFALFFFFLMYWASVIVVELEAVVVPPHSDKEQNLSVSVCVDVLSFSIV